MKIFKISTSPSALQVNWDDFHMNEYENRSKRLKLLCKEEIAQQKIEMEKMVVDPEKKSNFSSINPSNGAIVRGGANAKGDVRKLVIKNFKSKFPHIFSFIGFVAVRKKFQ